MPTLEFKGKPLVYAHHLSVPFRELVIDERKSCVPKGERPRLDDNLIIHGDNLHALKALLPVYAGKIDCIYIDPPYNTGNEGWCYNDNVRSPLMQEWLKKVSPVDREDLERHDKWLCMMWPRLKLLHELLSSRGSIWVTLDDIEQHRMRSLLDDIFGEDNLVANVVWKARESVQNDTDISTNNVNHIICYAKKRRQADRRLKASNAKTWFTAEGFVILPAELDAARYENPDEDSRGPWKADPFDAPGVREDLEYAIRNPKTREDHFPPPGRHWRMEEAKYKEALADKRIVFGKSGGGGGLS